MGGGLGLYWIKVWKPIEHYEGVSEWTAARNLTDRILLGDLFQAYIPDITYKLVRTREYSNEELLSKEDAISLVMLLNKIQQAEDFQEVSTISGERLNEIFQRAPADAAETIVATVQSLCVRLNLTTSETADFIEKVKGGNRGYLFENMEKMDIQLERRNTDEQRQRAEKAEQDKQNFIPYSYLNLQKTGNGEKRGKEAASDRVKTGRKRDR